MTTKIEPPDPAIVAHYLAALSAAKLSPATVSSTFLSAEKIRELLTEIQNLSIPAAARLLRARFAK
jgi:hypothetical protein